jgi:hypothetical protein
MLDHRHSRTEKFDSLQHTPENNPTYPCYNELLPEAVTVSSGRRSHDTSYRRAHFIMSAFIPHAVILRWEREEDQF